MEMNVIDFCKTKLNGDSSVEISLDSESSFLLTSSSKIEALNAGMVIVGNTHSKTIVIKSFQTASKMQKSSSGVPEQNVKIEKPDPNVPFSDFFVPAVVEDMITLLTTEKSCNIWIYGPTQCGKSTAVRYIGHKLGRKVEQINCKGDMDSHHFFGHNTIINGNIVFQKGCVERSMTEGLNDKGEVVGEPGILFIDEAAAIPTEIAIGLNNTLESGKNIRTLTLPEDGNRVVKSHPGWRVLLASNNNGTGSTSLSSQLYTAQQCALDGSLLQRMNMMIRFGYDKKAEERIVLLSCENQEIVKLFLTFKQGIRDALKRGELITPFSTKRVIDIMDMYQVFLKGYTRNTMKTHTQALGKAIYYSAYEILSDEEKKKYEELWYPISGERISEWSFASNPDVDYM